MDFVLQTELVIIAGVIILLIAAITGIVAMMSILRHRRHMRQDRALAAAPSFSNSNRRPAEETLERLREETNPTRPDYIPIPAHLRLPVQPGGTNLEVIKIEPKPEKTQEQRNIERIIEYFKNDVTPAEASAG
ncbi:MAG: hypothetical protein H6672_14465 [Anaerolineaceae bacterium]|nr:hypothetical protein [Anaerolineaceae bacterium]